MKPMLVRMAPPLQAFLDRDRLDDLSGLMTLLGESQHMLILLSKGYFEFVWSNQWLGISHRVINSNSRAGRIHICIHGIEVNQVGTDMVEGEKISLATMLL